jgi:DNA-binding MarR family transcriptional regulator
MENLVSAISHLAWPIVMLVVFFAMRKELRDLVGRIRTFKAGKVELKFSEELKQQGFTKKQLTSLRALSANEIDLFLLVSFSDNKLFNYRTGLEIGAFKQIIQKLEEAGLLEILNPEDDGADLRHNLTPLGRRMRSLFVNSSVELLHRSE